MDKGPHHKVTHPIPPAPPLLTDAELKERAVWLKATDGNRVHAYIEMGHLAIKGPGMPPVYIRKDEKDRLRALMDLPILPPKCAHDRLPGDCPQCGIPAGPR